MTGCPGNNLKSVTHSKFNDMVYTDIEWGWFNTAFNCKVQINSTENLNGKLVLEIVNVDDATLYVYLQPNNFHVDQNKPTIGLIENNMVYNHYSWTKGGRKYEIPTDWTAYLIYNVGYGNGAITVKSWIDQYKEEDISKFDTVW